MIPMIGQRPSRTPSRKKSSEWACRLVDACVRAEELVRTYTRSLTQLVLFYFEIQV